MMIDPREGYILKFEVKFVGHRNFFVSVAPTEFGSREYAREHCENYVGPMLPLAIIVEYDGLNVFVSDVYRWRVRWWGGGRVERVV